MTPTEETKNTVQQVTKEQMEAFQADIDIVQDKHGLVIYPTLQATVDKIAAVIGVARKSIEQEGGENGTA